MTGLSARSPSLLLALNYAPRGARDALAALFEWDADLGRAVATAREPVLTQLRLAWWREQLAGRSLGALPELAPLAERVAAAQLLPVLDSWEEVLVDEAGNALRSGAARGRAMFEAAAILLDDVADERSSAGWGLATLAPVVRDERLRQQLFQEGTALLASIARNQAKALRVLARLTRRELLGDAPGWRAALAAALA